MTTNNKIQDFLKYLILHGVSQKSLKYYKSDLVIFLAWAKDKKVSQELIHEYIESIRLITSTSTLNRRISTLKSFSTFMGFKKPVTTWQDKILSKFESKPKVKNTLYKIFFNRPNWYKKYHSYPLASYIHIAILILFTSVSGYALYDQVFYSADRSLAFPAALTRPNRFLSFQGRLTSNVGNPITSATNVVFRLYDASSGGTTLWNSGTCSITPDQDGIFSTLLGSSCGAEIASSVFSENAAVWVGVTVAADAEATPRIQIATVAYALNSETLQGFPAGTGTSTIPYINSAGTLVLANASPKLQSTSGTFAVEGLAMTISTPNASDGVITVNPDGVGTLDLTFEGAAPGLSANGFVNATNANITSGSLYSGTVASAASGYNFINFLSGVSPTSKFSVDSTGLTTVGADLYVSSGISLYNNAVTDDTIEAAKYCTGDGETNCVTDFSTFATGTNYWTRSAGNISPLTLNDTISATTSASVALTLTQTGAFNALLVEDQASDTTPFVIDQSGNVGIGTTTPSYKLDIQGGSERIVNGAPNNYANRTDSILFNRSDLLTTYSNKITNSMAGTAANTTMNFELTNTAGSGYTSVLTLNGSGNAGVGISNPSQRLTVGDVTGQNTMRVNGLSTADMAPVVSLFRSGNRESVIAQTLSGLVFANTAGLANYQDATIDAAIDMIITSGGNVGIGDTTPSQLFVVGNGDLFQVNSAGNVKAPTLVLGTATIAPTDRTFDLVDTTAIGSSTQYGSVVQQTFTGTSTSNISLFGDYVQVSTSATDGTQVLNSYGSYALNTLSAGNTIDNLYGSRSTAIVNSSALSPDTANTATMSAAVYANARIDAPGTITSQYGNYNLSYTNVDASTITASYAVFGQSNEGVTHTTGGIAFGYGGYFRSEDATNTVGSQSLGIQNTPGETFTNTYGAVDTCQSNNSTVTITNCYGTRGEITEALGTITNGYAGYFTSPNALVSSYGVYANVTGASTTNYGIYSNVSGATTNYAGIFVGGNVGIGDTTPDAPLDVTGDVYITDGLSLFETAVSDGTVEATQFCTGDGETNCITDFSSIVTGSSYWTRSAGNISPLTLNDTISATTSAAVAMTLTQTGAFNALLVQDSAGDTTPFAIDQSGNVGIFTPAPIAPLQINSDTATGNGAFFIGTGANASTMISAQGRAYFGYSAGNVAVVQGGLTKGIQFNVNNNTFGSGTAASITSAGLFGIGTTTPTALLDVAGDASASGHLVLRGSGTNYIHTLNGSNFGISTSVGGDTGNTDRLTILNNGNVGIGTTSPSELLTVSKTRADANTLLRLQETGTDTNTDIGIEFWQRDTGAGALDKAGRIATERQTTSSAYDMVFYGWTGSASSDYLRIENGGEIGIGSSQPDAKLEINSATGDNLQLTYNDADGGATAYTNFSLASDGDLTIDSAGGNVTLATGDILTVTAADIYAGSGISTYSTAATDGTVEATKFCTGDGETNCVTDFSSLGGATKWNAITSPDGAMSLNLGTNTTQFDYSGTSIGWTYNANSVTNSPGQLINANGLVAGSGLQVSSSSTAGSGGGSKFIITATSSGINANASHSSVGIASQVTNTGTTSTNIAGYFSASGASNNYAAIFASGNIGIGNSTPTELLDVAGNIRSTTGSLQIGNSANVAYSRFGTATTAHSGNVSTSADVLLEDLEVDGTLFLDGGIIANVAGTTAIALSATPTTTSNTLSSGNWTVDNTANVGQAALIVNNTKAGDLFTASASGVPKFTITNAGNVGIGTTAPQFQVQTSSNIEVGTLINTAYGGIGRYQNLLPQSEDFVNNWSVNNAGSTADTTTAPNGRTTADTITSTVANGYIYQSTGVLVSGQTFDCSVWLKTASGTQNASMSVVSIGLDGGDGTLFTVDTTWRRYQNTRTFGAVGGTAGIIIFPVSGGTGSIYAWGAQCEQSVTVAGAYVRTAGTAVTTANTGLIASDVSGSSLFAGKVGIGTTSPNETLEVSGALGNVDGIRMSYNSDTRYYNNLYNSWDGSTVANNFMTINIGTGTVNTTIEAMRLQGNGNVGIGTTAPAGKLDVSAGTRSGTHGSTPSFYVSGPLSAGQTGPAAGNIEFRHDNGSQGIGFGYNTIYQAGSNVNQDLNFLSKGSSAITLNAYGYSTGNVGIGDASPTNKLDVTGAIGISDTTVIDSSRNLTNIGTYSGSGSITSTGTTFSLGTATGSISNWAQVFDSAGDRLYMGFNGAQGADIQFYANGFSNAVSQIFYEDGSITGGSYTYTGGSSTIMNGNQFYCNNASNCHFNYSGTGTTYVGNSAGTVLGGIVTVASELTLSGTAANIALGSNYLSGDGGDEGIYVGSTGHVGIGLVADATQHLWIKGGGASAYATVIENGTNNSTANGLAIRAGTFDGTGTSVLIDFYRGDGSAGLQGQITQSGGTVTYAAFTANHNTTIPSEFNNSGYPYGTLLCIDNAQGGNEIGNLRAIKYQSSACNLGKYSQKILGVYAGKLDSEPNLHQVYVLGDGQILINGEGGNIKVGDRITTSNATGIGMKANDYGATFGIAQEDYNFNSPDEVKLIAVQYGLGYNIPELALNETGEATINGNETAGYTAEVSGKTVNKIASFAEATIAKLRVGIGSFKKVETNLISPVANADLIIDLQPDDSQTASKLVIKGENNEEVASIDANGSATFAGQVNSEQLAVNSDATISGTLYANVIESDRLDEIESLLAEVEGNQTLFAEAINWDSNTATESASITDVIASNLFVTGNATVNSLFVAENLTARSLDSLDGPLNIQSLAINPIEIMAGKIKIDIDGNAVFTGNVSIAGNLELSGNFVVAEGIDPTATMSATIIEGQTNSNSTAGKAVLIANTTELKIINPKVKLDSLIYVTPVSPTENKVLYVKSKNIGEFTIGFNEPIATDVEFNWWIIELKTIE